MPIFWPYLFTYGNPVKAIDRQTIPFTHRYLFDGILRFVHGRLRKVLRFLKDSPFSSRYAHCDLPPPSLKILMPLSQALVKNWYRCGQHAFPPALRKGPMWQKINLSKVSKPFPLRIPLDVLIAAPEIVYRCELISQRFSFEDSIIIA